MLGKLWSDRGGAAAVEYALLAGLLSAALVAVLLSVGAGIDQTMHKAERPSAETLVIRS